MNPPSLVEIEGENLLDLKTSKVQAELANHRSVDSCSAKHWAPAHRAPAASSSKFANQENCHEASSQPEMPDS